MTKRLTSKDYRKQLQDLVEQKKALEARIRNRCVEMIKQNPKVSMGTIEYANAPAKEVFTGDYLKTIEKTDVNSYGISTIFDLMETIEADLETKQSHKQTTINF